MESQNVLKSCIVSFGFDSFQSHTASHLSSVIIEGVPGPQLVTQRTYLGEIMLGGAHDPLPPFEAFPEVFFATGWDMAPCGVLTVLASLGVFCCLQMLMELGLSVKELT